MLQPHELHHPTYRPCIMDVFSAAAIIRAESVDTDQHICSLARPAGVQRRDGRGGAVRKGSLTHVEVPDEPTVGFKLPDALAALSARYDVVAMAAKQVYETPVPPRARHPDLPVRIERVILKCVFAPALLFALGEFITPWGPPNRITGR